METWAKGWNRGIVNQGTWANPKNGSVVKKVARRGVPSGERFLNKKKIILQGSRQPKVKKARPEKSYGGGVRGGGNLLQEFRRIQELEGGKRKKRWGNSFPQKWPQNVDKGARVNFTRSGIKNEGGGVGDRGGGETGGGMGISSTISAGWVNRKKQK